MLIVYKKKYKKKRLLNDRIVNMTTVYKPWGREVWLELNDKYCYKRIYIDAGSQTSYHYHEIKSETNYIVAGKVEFWLENEEGVVEKTIMNEGEYVTVLPPRKHRVVAITDAILQEVSTPEVDDVIRIEDDTNRPSGKIESEHNKPGVMILAAGKGERLKSLTENMNKALIPINNQAIISKIIKKFPSEYKFVITLGYKGEMIEEYLNIAFPNYDFEFVYIEDFESSKSGPGYSALACKEYLQRPFYLVTVDCLISSPLPSLNGNWLGVHPTGYPEKYSTVKFDKNHIIKEFVNKSEDGFDHAFIGLAAFTEYEKFWSELENNISAGELVSSFDNPSAYENFEVKVLDWFDTGNLDDLEKAKLYFRDKPLSLSKSSNEVVYKEESRFIKYISNSDRLEGLYHRGIYLDKLTPKNLIKTENFLYYDWVNGETLYAINKIELYKEFISYYLSNVDPIPSSKKDIKNFYQDKTNKRIEKFKELYGNEYFENSYVVNEKKCKSLSEIMKKINLSKIEDNNFTKNFHGDLQFDNILYSSDGFNYIDWRDYFGSSNEAGDVYYDLSKLYGGILMPYNLMKDENNIEYFENNLGVTFSYEKIERMDEIINYFIKSINDSEFEFSKIELIVGIIFLNMAPLHDEKFGKLLWFNGISILSDLIDK